MEGAGGGGEEGDGEGGEGVLCGEVWELDGGLSEGSGGFDMCVKGLGGLGHAESIRGHSDLERDVARRN